MHFDQLASGWLLLIFLSAAAAVWIAGIYVSATTDVISQRLGLGEALGGMLLLAIVTNLPEIAITTSAALHHDLGIAIGNILGGIAMQTLVLVLLDFFGLGKKGGLTYRAASLGLVLEGLLVIAVLTMAILGHEMPSSLIYGRVTPAGLGIVLVWLLGLYLVSKARQDLPWQEKGDAPGGQDEPRGHSRKKKSATKKMSTRVAVAIFLVAALVTLVSGVALELSGESLAKYLGMSGGHLRRDCPGGRDFPPGSIDRAGLGEAGRLQAGHERHLRRERLSPGAFLHGDLALRGSRPASGAANGYLSHRARDAADLCLSLRIDLPAAPTICPDGDRFPGRPGHLCGGDRRIIHHRQRVAVTRGMPADSAGQSRKARKQRSVRVHL